MADGFWPGRRVLVLGGTGFVGGWAVRGLLARGADVVTLVRDGGRDSDFFRNNLHRHVHVVRGRAEDPVRVRTLLAAYETEVLVQLAADPDGSAEAFTRVALSGLPSGCRAVVPVRPGPVPRVVSAGPSSPAVTFVSVPHLFGGGDPRPDRWVPRLMTAAARGELLPPPPDAAAEFLHVRDAAEGLLEACEHAAGFHAALAPHGTAAELFDAVRGGHFGRPRLARPADGPAAFGPYRPFADAVSDTLDAYRAAAHAAPVARPKAA